MFKLIVSDFDNTLVGHDLVLDQVIVDHVIKLKEQAGINFTVASGRGYYGNLSDAVAQMHISTPVIIRNGAEIVDPQTHKALYGKYMKPEVTSEIVKHIIANNFEFYVEKGEFTYSRNAVPGKHAPNEQYLDINTIDFENIPKILIKVNNMAEAEELHEYISSAFPDQIAIKMNPIKDGDVAVDVNSSEVSKASAVKYLREYLGVRKEEVIAIGDNNNDMPLFEEAGFKVAVGNALESLKSKADYIAPSEEENGVAYFIDQLIAGNVQ